VPGYTVTNEKSFRDLGSGFVVNWMRISRR